MTCPDSPMRAACRRNGANEPCRSIPTRFALGPSPPISSDSPKIAISKTTVCLFHSPPYRTDLDRAALDGHTVDHAPLDLHVGSIAIQRFIEDRQPLLTLHGHIHESPRLTGNWRQKIGRTHAFTAAHDGPELALVRFDLDDLDNATRELL